jgi:hypothetical protein
MKSIVVSCDRYINLLTGFSTLFNKHWPNQEVTVLCYKVPEFPLPSNFSIISLGHNHDPYWTDGLIPYFESLTDDYFALFLEDHFVIHDVNLKLLKMAIDMIEVKEVQRVHLGEDACPNWKYYSDNFNIWHTTRKSRCLAPVSLEPGIWTKELFMKFLRPHLTAIEFESENIATAIAMKVKTVIPTTPIYESIDAYRSGKFNPRIVERKDNVVLIAGKPHYISNEDLEVFLATQDIL